MRMRTRGHLAERLEDCRDLFFENGRELDEDFLRPPLHIEIGCGKGRFIVQTAKENPSVHYIASEMVDNVVVLAAEKAKRENLTNVRFVRGDFMRLSEFIPDGAAERIYLNFSDPWPKKGHAKRRLTHKNFLDVYKRILTDGGEIHFKTDNRPLFDFSLESFAENGFELSEITYDLHQSAFEGNVMTEYEERFSGQGVKINRAVAKKR